jgi:PAS domain S-box-containing protein
VATWNAGAERLKGYSASDIVGKHFSTFYPPDALDRGWPAEELRRAAADGRIEDEGWRVRKDGSTFWANVVITALRDDDGALRGYAKVTRDLTDRKRAEEDARRLAEEEAGRKAAEAAAAEIERQRVQLHVTLTSIGDAVIVTDTAGVVTFVNPVAAELTGWPPQEAAGRPVGEVFEILNEHTREAAENPVPRVLRGGVVVGLADHTVLVARDGREVPVSDSAAPIRGRDGAVAGVVLVFRDETEPRRAAEARLRLAAIVESSDDAIIGQTLDGVVTSWNGGAERLYGYTAAEMVGRTLAALAPADHADEQPELLDRVRRGDHVHHFETQRVCRDGRRVDVSLTLSPIRDACGRVAGASKIARDITERKAEDRRKSEFLALLAHELRNPLAPLRNGLKVLELAADDPAAVAQARAAMDRQLAHVVRLVDDLLDVSRITQGKLLLRKEVLPLAAVVGHALELCDATVKQSGHRLTVTLPDEPVYVDADKTRLAQTVCNLLTNAVKYSDPGSGLRLAARREGGEAVLSVADEGVGLAPDMLGRVFDMFTQVDRTLEKSQGGLGVGLGIVKRLVELHGGRVEARSEGLGRGSEFVVRLPLAPPPAVTPEGPAVEAWPVRTAALRVLITDDSKDAAGSLATLLRVMGHRVETASDGLAAIEAGAAFLPDLVLMDIGMPRLNGYEACRRIREQPWGERVTVIALTGWGQEEDRRRSRQAGFDGHFVKPIDLGELEKVLASVTGGKKGA